MSVSASVSLALPFDEGFLDKQRGLIDVLLRIPVGAWYEKFLRSSVS